MIISTYLTYLIIHIHKRNYYFTLSNDYIYKYLLISHILVVLNINRSMVYMQYKNIKKYAFGRFIKNMQYKYTKIYQKKKKSLNKQL